MAAVGTTIVFPAKGVALYLPGGVHAFTDTAVGVPLRSDHAGLLAATGSLETKASREKQAAEAKAAADVAAAEAEKQAASAMPAAVAAPGEPAA